MFNSGTKLLVESSPVEFVKKGEGKRGRGRERARILCFENVQRVLESIDRAIPTQSLPDLEARTSISKKSSLREHAYYREAGGRGTDPHVFRVLSTLGKDV